MKPRKLTPKAICRKERVRQNVASAIARLTDARMYAFVRGEPIEEFDRIINEIMNILEKYKARVENDYAIRFARNRIKHMAFMGECRRRELLMTDEEWDGLAASIKMLESQSWRSSTGWVENLHKSYKGYGYLMAQLQRHADQETAP